jgi:EAL domain-containing protein (putative c-di-GMP-specific phosphodiesterase class I)
VVTIPESAACNISYFREFVHALRNLGIGVAYHNFAGGEARIAEHREIGPDYIVLAHSLVSGLHRNHERQRRVETVLRACQELGCDAIATAVSTLEEAATCRDLGCRFAQGEYFDKAHFEGSEAYSTRR